LGAIVLLFIRGSVDSRNYFIRLWRVMSLIGLFLIELVRSSWSVFKLAFKRDLSQLKPGFFAYPLKVQNDFQITLLANLITLTPGTLSVDVSDNRKTLYIHSVHVPDPQATMPKYRMVLKEKLLRH
jgi:multicomponent Na+:H+ antiporter subunit E